MLKLGLCCGPVFICLSVTLVHCIHTAEDNVKLILQPGSLIVLVFDPQLQGEPLLRRCKVQGGGKILRFSTEIAVYLGNGMR